MTVGNNPGIRIPSIGECHDGVRTSIRQIVRLFGYDSSPMFSSLTLSGLTASRLLATNSSSAFASVTNLASWIAGTSNEINITDDGDGTITIGLVDPLIVTKGGTGLAALTDHGILLGSGTSAITPLGVATHGQLPIGSTGADPVLATLTASTGISISNAAGSITISCTVSQYTDADARAAISENITGIDYDNNTGVFSLTTGYAIPDTTSISSWDAAYGWGDHAGLYDSVGTASGLISGHESTYNHTNYNTAYGWGDHSGLYDLTGTASGLITTHETTYSHTNYDTAYGWGDHSSAGYLTDLVGLTTDGLTEGVVNLYFPGFTDLFTDYGFTDNSTNWDAAYGWGDHAGLYDVAGAAAAVTPTTLGLVIGTNTQAYSANLTAIAGLAVTDSNIIVGDGATWVAESGATARTSLGLGAGDSPTFAGGTLSWSGDKANTLALADGGYAAIDFKSYKDGQSHNFCRGYAARGTVASPSDVINTDNLIQLEAAAYINGAFHPGSAYVRLWMDSLGTVSSTSCPTRISFYTNADGTMSAPALRLDIRHNGYIGIGNIVPNEMLEVSGKIRTNTAFNLNGSNGVSDSGSGVPTALTVAGGIVTAITKNDYLDQAVKTTSSPAFAGLTVDTNVLYVDAVNNRVGIGTTSPTTGLHVNGGILAFGNIWTGQTINSGFFIDVLNGYTSGFGADGSSNPGIYVNGAQKLTVLNSNGRVGIGTASPNELLEVNGKIRANTAFNLNGSDGVSGSFTTVDLKTVTVTGGIITAIV